ncbi:TetR/AcrR family transcriptional regulator [candidate division KSB1 bacterium]|nr:TetR/AcrR family transcriptional regulator [candidate division KSB1 bacterium]
MPKIVDKEAKKLEIMQAALGVFAKRGVANTKMAEIAEAAGIGKGTIYEYFQDKNEIFMETFKHFMNIVETTLGKRLLRLKDPVEKLKVIITGWIDIFEEFGYEFIRIMLEFWAEGIRSNPDNLITGSIDLKQFYADYRFIIINILEEGVESGKFRPINTTLTAAILIGALDGLMLQWALDASNFSLKDANEQLYQNLIEGIIK